MMKTYNTSSTNSRNSPYQSQHSHHSYVYSPSRGGHESKTPTSQTIKNRFSVQAPKASVFDVTESYIDKIDDILCDPIKCGYLLAFCKTQFSSENIEYLLEVDFFRDYFESDPTAWEKGTKKWFKIDIDVGIHSNIIQDMDVPVIDLNSGDSIKASKSIKDNNSQTLELGDESKWPSRKVSYVAISKFIHKIWDEYLSNDAPNQICIPYNVMLNTLKRLQYLHLYGKSC